MYVLKIISSTLLYRDYVRNLLFAFGPGTLLRHVYLTIIQEFIFLYHFVVAARPLLLYLGMAKWALFFL